MIGYVIGGLVALSALLLLGLGIALDMLKRTDERAKELKRAKEDLEQRLADMQATINVVFGEEPDLDGDAGRRLRDEITAASRGGGAAGGGLSAVEQAAADRVRGAAAARS